MLPRFAKITGKRQRAALIAAKMKAAQFDILVFQEAFLGDARRIIYKALEDHFPYEYGPANRKFSIKTNSGIWVLSRIPLLPLAEIDYSDCVGFDDCFARKGAMLLQGEWNRRKFQLLGTHLQAGGPDSIRHRQYVEIRQLLDRFQSPEILQIIAGDFNTGDTDTAQYRDMLATLDAVDGPLSIQVQKTDQGYPNDLHSNGLRSFRIIDYIFLRPCRSQPQIERDYLQYQSPWGRHQDLSDHFGVAARIWM